MATVVRERVGAWHEPVGSVLKRVSWGAIFAGTVVTLVLLLTFTLLGLGIGLGVISPATAENPMGGVGIGAGIWMLITTLISIFCGAWVAGKLAGSPRSITGVLHGITVWGLVTLLSFYLMTSAVGVLVSGAASIIGRGVSMLSGAAAPVIQQQMAQRGFDLNTIISEGQKLMTTRGKGGAKSTTLQPVITKLFSGQQPAAADRQKAVNALVANTNMSRAEATRTVDNWITRFNQARTQLPQQAQDTMRAISKAALLAFAIMLLGAGAGALGGAFGAPKELETCPYPHEREREYIEPRP